MGINRFARALIYGEFLSELINFNDERGGFKPSNPSNNAARDLLALSSCNFVSGLIRISFRFWVKFACALAGERRASSLSH